MGLLFYYGDLRRQAEAEEAKKREQAQKNYEDLQKRYYTQHSQTGPDDLSKLELAKKSLEEFRLANPGLAKDAKTDELNRLQRELDRQRGAFLGQERFGTTDYAAEHMDQLRRLRDQMNLGTLSPELMAARSARLADLQRQEAMTQRQLAAQAAQSGIRGGALSSRLASTYGLLGQQRQDAARQMFLEDLAKREQSRQTYANYLGKLHLGQLASEAGEQLMGQGERTATKQLEAAKEAALAARSASGGKK